jgi:hypothetical protein
MRDRESEYVFLNKGFKRLVIYKKLLETENARLRGIK